MIHPQLITAVNDTLPENVSSLCVALSGGLDSSVLLDILHSICQKRNIQLSALHVNHQISPNAKEWALFCQKKCENYEIAYEIKLISCLRQGGESLEEVARRQRYHAYASQPAPWIALAHHLDDQVETFFIQLFRGSGVRGLSSMPLSRAFGPHKTIWRPLLNFSRRDLERYAHERNLSWIEDESNQDTRYLRNFFRKDILPLIEERLPSYRQVVQRTQNHFQEIDALLASIGKEDLTRFYCSEQKAVDIKAFQDFFKTDPLRARHALRFLISQLACLPFSTQQFEELIKQLCDYHAESHLTIQHDTSCFVAYQGSLYFLPRFFGKPFSTLETWTKTWDWKKQKTLFLPEIRACLTLEIMPYSVAEQSYPSHFLLDLLKLPAVLDLKMRTGQETLRIASNRPQRTLKQHYQSAKIPPFFRTRLPLVYANTKLCFVPFIGTASTFQPEKINTMFFSFAMPRMVGIIHFKWEDEVIKKIIFDGE